MSAFDDQGSVVEALASKYPIFAPRTIERLVAAETAKYANSKVHAFVPVLVMRSVGERLREANGADDTL